MPKRSVQSIAKRPKRPRDVNQLAHQLVRESTERHEVDSPVKPTPLEISRVMTAMGQKGGKIGGKRRAEVLDQKRRSEIASQAAKKRWGSRKAS